VGAADEKLAQLKKELGSLAGELRRSAEELQDLNTSLNDTLQDTKAVERRCVCVCVCVWLSLNETLQDTKVVERRCVCVFVCVCGWFVVCVNVWMDIHAFALPAPAPPSPLAVTQAAGVHAAPEHRPGASPSAH